MGVFIICLFSSDIILQALKSLYSIRYLDFHTVLDIEKIARVCAFMHDTAACTRGHFI